MTIESRKITLGTKEWADSNVNCYLGCSNDCRYCYAKKMAIRFKNKSNKSWKIMTPNQKNIIKGYKKRRGRIMFPTSHDITIESLDNCFIVLEKLVKSKNEVLVTTKPKFECIKKICHQFLKYSSLIQFRFTITSNDNKLLKFWEPNAPLFEERLNSLKYAFKLGYRTSISIEPFLDSDPYRLIEILKSYVTESIWIGKMNYIKCSNLNSNEVKYYNLIRNNNSKENLKKIVLKARKYERLVRIKDSIINYLQSQEF